MAIQQLTPYLSFSGTAAAALEFYTRALGAEAESVMRYGEMPADVGTCKAEDTDKIMHAELRVGAGRLMLSDAPHPLPETESTVRVVLDFDDHDDMARKFDALAEGGSVEMALHEAFWGGKFGQLTDKFGVSWMFTSVAATRH